MTTLKTMIFLLSISTAAFAQSPWDLAKKVAGKEASAKVEKEVNNRLLAEGRKDQCSFKTDSEQLMPGCDQKLKNLANALIDAKKNLNNAGVSNFKFEVSGHTDSSGSAEHNKELSGRRAAVIAKELVARGVPESEITSIGMGADKRLVSPAKTAGRKRKNGGYEIRVGI